MTAMEEVPLRPPGVYPRKIKRPVRRPVDRAEVRAR